MLRLQAAMAEAVASHGYGGTTVRELARLAGVSKTTFYEHFENKQECFISAFDEIVDQACGRLATSWAPEDDLRGRLETALGELMDMVIREHRASTLVVVESLSLGVAGVRHRERGSAKFEATVRRCFKSGESERQPSATVIRAIVAGVQGVVYRRLRTGDTEGLPDVVPGLVDWILSYGKRESALVRRAAEVAAEPCAGVPVETRAGFDWRLPPDSPQSRAELSQRDRIVSAIGRLALENEYEDLSIPAISATAGTSNQTFYEHFSDKREAFLAVFDVSASEALLVTEDAFKSRLEFPEAVGAATRALLEHIAASELFARLTFFALLTAGRPALDRGDEVMDRFGELLGLDRSPAQTGHRNPELGYAIGCGCWSVIQHELAKGAGDSLPGGAPELVRILLTPFAKP
jgi:AcrR family transcriptional regulator